MRLFSVDTTLSIRPIVLFALIDGELQSHVIGSVPKINDQCCCSWQLDIVCRSFASHIGPVYASDRLVSVHRSVDYELVYVIELSECVLLRVFYVCISYRHSNCHGQQTHFIRVDLKYM